MNRISKETPNSNIDNHKGNSWSLTKALIYSVAIFLIAQFVPIIIVVYPIIFEHLTMKESFNWLTNSIYAQFIFIFLFEGIIVYFILLFLKKYKIDKKEIGLRKPILSDLFYAFVGLLAYFIIYFIAIILASSLIKGLNLNQKQNVGFNSVYGVWEYLATFVSLVILPPIAEEIFFRGFIYSSFRNKIPKIWAAILTSLIFASLHLPEGVGGLLWVGALDTFVLSMVLIYIREKTKGLYAGMLIHALKNGLAYYVLYIAPIIGLIRIR